MLLINDNRIGNIIASEYGFFACKWGQSGILGFAFDLIAHERNEHELSNLSPYLAVFPFKKWVTSWITKSRHLREYMIVEESRGR